MKSRIISFFKKILENGLTTKSIALSLSLSLLLTTFPIYGLTTLLLTAIAVKWKLNLPLTLLMSYSLEPLRFLLFVPFIEISEALLHSSNTTYTVSSIATIFSQDFFMNFYNLSVLIGKAILGWCVIMLPIIMPIYYFSLFLIGRIKVESLIYNK